MNAPAAELAQAAEHSALLAERDALAAENARLREAVDKFVVVAGRIANDARAMSGVDEGECMVNETLVYMLKGALSAARALVEAPR